MLLVTAFASGAAGPAKDAEPKGNGPRPAADGAGSRGNGSTAGAADRQEAPPVPVPVRPKRGLGRLTGTESRGTRHGRDPNLYVAVLAPARRDFAAVTTRPQPTLFWFLSKPTDRQVTLTIAAADAAEALWEQTGPAGPPGVRRLDVAALTTPDGKPVALKPGQPYKFSVMLVENSRAPANNPYVACWVECVAPPAGLPRRLAEARPADRAAAYADEGIWYDALAEIDDQIRANPRHAALLRGWRAGLLRDAEDPQAKPEQQLLRKVADADQPAGGAGAGGN